MMYHVLLIGLGGFLGAISRYILTGTFSKFFFSASSPYSTALVNLTGCFLFGLIAALVSKKFCFSEEHLFFTVITVGFIGSFTTFSAYSYDSFCLLEQGKIIQMSLNIALQTILGVAFIGLGYSIVSKLTNL